VRNETPVKSEGFFFLLHSSFFIPDEKVFFFSRSKKNEEGRRKKEKCSIELRTVFTLSTPNYSFQEKEKCQQR
jgi:hypothetical protein